MEWETTRFLLLLVAFLIAASCRKKQAAQSWESIVKSIQNIAIKALPFFLVALLGLGIHYAARGSPPDLTLTLPVEVKDDESGKIMDWLTSKGVRTSRYDSASNRIVVSESEGKEAIVALAEGKHLSGVDTVGFEELLDKWIAEDISDEIATRENAVEQLIERLEPIRDATVIYSDSVRNSIFGVAHQITAAVRVKTTVKDELGDDTVGAVISLVAAVKTGLDPRDVVITDQRGNKYTLFPTFDDVVEKSWDLEMSLNTQLGKELTDALKKRIPGIDNDGYVEVFARHEMDIAHSIRGSTLNSFVAMKSSELLGHILALGRKIDDAIHSGRRYRDIAEMLPGLEKLTISVIILLPYQLKPEGNVSSIQGKNGISAPLTNTGSDRSTREKESVPPLSSETIAQLKSLIADIAGIAPSDISKNIEISQVPWIPPVVPGQDPLPVKKPVRSGMYALPLPIEPDTADNVLSALADGAIKTAEYNADAKRILVAVGDEKKAILALAEKDLLSDGDLYKFGELLDRWYSNAPDKKTPWLRGSMDAYVARLIEELESIAKAAVVYTDKHGYFGSSEAKGMAWVTTKRDRELSEDTVSAIASLVEAGMSGLNRQNVFVVDQFGEFYVPAVDLNDSNARIKRMTEHRLNRRLRRVLTTNLSQFIRNITYEGGISVFPSHTVARDSFSSEIAECSFVSTLKTTICDDHIQSVDIADVTVHVLVHLPYQLKRDAEGSPIRARNSLGDPITDPVTGSPEWEKESAPVMERYQIEEMKRHIAKTINIDIREQSEKISIHQIPWGAKPLRFVGGKVIP